jgi:arylsulfatase A-like enzyme
MAAFMASARILDEGVGIVLDALDSGGLSDETLVICTTDHGIAFPGMKCNLTDHGIGVMLIMRGPGGFTGGAVCDAMVSHVDLFPTVCDLLDIGHPSWLQGASMMPLVRGTGRQIHDALYAEVTYHAAYEPQRAVRTLQYKYVRRFDKRTSPVLPNCDDSLSKDLWLQYGWRDREPAEEQLYDLVFDPSESCNLAGHPEMTGTLQEMRRRLEAWMQATDDPLLRGPVPAPSCARVNDPDGLSPREPTVPVAPGGDVR